MTQESTPQIEEQKIDKYHLLEIAELFTRTRDLLNLRVQLFAFIGTANVAALGFAIESRLASIFLLAAALMSILILFDIYVQKTERVLYLQSLATRKEVCVRSR